MKMGSMHHKRSEKNENIENLMAENIKSLRRERGYTKTYVAEKVGVNRKAYSKWEIGGHPDIENLSALADFYGVSVDYIIGRTDFHDPKNEFIGQCTGLSDRAVDSIIGIKQESENWKENADAAGIQPGYDDINALNKLLEYESLFSNILRAFQNLLKIEYLIPVHFENGKPAPADTNNLYEYLPGFEKLHLDGHYLLNLCRDEKKPWDFNTISLNSSFFRSVALNQITETFLTIANLHKDKSSETEK